MNIASGCEINILEIVEPINELTGNKAGITWVERRIWDTKKRLLASIDKAKVLLGYEPKMNFEDRLKATIQWFKNNWDNIKRDAEFPRGMSAAAFGVVCK